MKKNFWFAVALLLALPFTVYGAGAIAVDDEEGEEEPGYGFVTGYESRDKAGKAALKQCRERDNTNCKVVVRFDTCGAFVVSPKYYGVGWGNTKEKAINMALENCKGKCRIVIAECE
jgi:hypothetical protein